MVLRFQEKPADCSIFSAHGYELIIYSRTKTGAHYLAESSNAERRSIELSWRDSN